jgi:predicted transcriptional regulator
MARKLSTNPTEGALAILRVLWESGPSTVRPVHDTLAPHSDGEHARVLTHLVRKPDVSSQVLAGVICSVRSIVSNGEAATVLVNVAGRQLPASRREAYVAAAELPASSGERRRAMTALNQPPPIAGAR